MCQNLRNRFERETGLDVTENQNSYLEWLENLEAKRLKDKNDIDKANSDIAKVNYEDDLMKGNYGESS